jgi:hypothetical protein
MKCRIRAHSAQDIRKMWAAFMQARDTITGFSLSYAQIQEICSSLNQPPDTGVYFEVFDPEQVRHRDLHGSN